MSAQKKTYSPKNTDFAGDTAFVADYANHREEANHLGNVLTVVSDRKIAVEDQGNPGTVEYYEADVVSARDYYPFGMIMPGRSVSAGEYWYGFNAQEMDNEWASTGSHIAFEYRIHDTRLGRFLSVDPIGTEMPWLSPYQFASNTPIQAIDRYGLQAERVTKKADDYKDTPYEWGGKSPAFKGGLPEGKDDEWYFENVGNPSREAGGAINNPNYSNEVNLNQYLEDGATSCGIDCSGLAGTAFNADEEKLMDDFDLNFDNARAMRTSFNEAGEDNTGYLGNNIQQQIQEGDLVFNANASHVMVATGKGRSTEDGQTQIEVIHAPETGRDVTREWRNVGDNWNFGRTWRESDGVILDEVEITPDN